MKLLLNIVGILVVLAVALLLSWDRKNIPWKTVVKGLVVQFVIAILLVKLPIGRTIVSVVSDAVTAVINCGQSGLNFVFGSLNDGTAGYIFIVQTLGNIIFVSSQESITKTVSSSLKRCTYQRLVPHTTRSLTTISKGTPIVLLPY